MQCEPCLSGSAGITYCTVGQVWFFTASGQACRCRRVPGRMRHARPARGLSEKQVMNDVLLAAQPTKRFVTAEQVAALACYLAGDDAAPVTGTLLPVDGGWTAQ